MARISQKQHFDALPGCSLQWSSFARSDYFISRGVDRIRRRETHRAKLPIPRKESAVRRRFDGETVDKMGSVALRGARVKVGGTVSPMVSDPVGVTPPACRIVELRTDLSRRRASALCGSCA